MWANLSIYDSNEFYFSRPGKQPSAPPDAFEPGDNQRQNAILYLPNQVHTIHEVTDGDWFKFPILPGKTGTYQFSLSLQGEYVYVKGILFKAGSSTPIQEITLSGRPYDQPVPVNFAEEGMYYLYVAPPITQVFIACDNNYALKITPSPWVRQLYLPVAVR